MDGNDLFRYVVLELPGQTVVLQVPAVESAPRRCVYDAVQPICPGTYDPTGQGVSARKPPTDPIA